ncbi:MAG: outer membrane protein assembly factor BamA [Legionellales bacterium]|jgi:outer membrane protein insertion porin family
MLKLKYFVSFMFLMLVSSIGFADDYFVIKDIKVEGLQRIDVGTVYNDLPVSVGDTLYMSETPEIIRELYATGNYSNISLAREGNTLVVTVEERPTIGRIEISGNEDIETEALEEGLEYAGITEGNPYDPSVLEKVTKELEYQYFSHGKYNVDITSTVVKLPRNRVGIEIDISEGEVTKIREINFVGNEVFDDAELLDTFQSTTTNWLSWISSSDQYSRERLMGDLENLQFHYMNNGYLNMKVESTQVSIVPSRKDIYVTVNIVEGEQYTISEVSVGGDLVVPREELEKYTEIFEEGELFNRQKMMQVNEYITSLVGNEGYAFVEVHPMTEVNEEEKTVAITYLIEPNQLVYVRDIYFSGNYVSQEEILRRELTQLEGALVSTAKIQRSRNNLYLLGYLDNINIETVPVPGQDDIVDLHVTVEERPSGQLTGGVGYSQLDGLLFNLGVSQANFLGTGNIASFLFNTSEYFTSYNLSYTDPYYTEDGISRGFSVFYSAADLAEADVSNYVRDIWGGAVNYSVPINPNNRFYYGYGYENILIKTGSDPNTVSDQVQDFVDENGNDFNAYEIILGWTRNTLDRVVFPTEGSSTNLGVNIVVPGSTLTYYKTTLTSRWYKPIYDPFVLMVRGTVAYGDGLLSTEELPFYENYYLGGVTSMRGFADNSIGPEDSLDDPIGGNFRFNGTTEIFFPLPYVEVSSVRTSLFFDVGSLYNTYGDDPDSEPMRTSVGTTAQWYSPLGPLVVSLGFPITKAEDDTTEVFQFSIGAVL